MYYGKPLVRTNWFSTSRSSVWLSRRATFMARNSLVYSSKFYYTGKSKLTLTNILAKTIIGNLSAHYTPKQWDNVRTILLTSIESKNRLYIMLCLTNRAGSSPFFCLLLTHPPVYPNSESAVLKVLQFPRHGSHK